MRNKKKSIRNQPEDTPDNISNNQDLRFELLNEAHEELIEFSTTHEICVYAVNKIYNFLEKQAIVWLVDYNYESNRWKTIHFEGLGDKIAKIAKLSGFDLINLEGEISTKYYERIRQLKTVELDFDFPGLFNNQFSDALGVTIKAILGVDKMYCIPFHKKEEIFGNLTIITKKGTTTPDLESINSYVLKISNYVKRLKVEEELKKNEEKYRRIAENIKDVVWTTDLELNTTYVSPSIINLAGVTHDEYLKLSPEKKHPAATLTNLKNTLQKELDKDNDPSANPNRTIVIEGDHITLKGKILKVLMHTSFIRNSEGKPIGIQGITRDISDEVKVKSENQIFKTISDQAVYGKAIADIKGKIIYVNKFFADIHGYSPAELVDQHISLFHTPQQFEKVNKTINSLITEGVFEPTEIWHVDRNGNEFPMLMSGVLASDITDNRKIIATSAIDLTSYKKAEEKYQSLFNEMFDAFALHKIITDDSGAPVDYKFLAVNPAFEEMTGLVAEKIIGKSVLEILPETEKMWIETYGEVVITGKPVLFENYSAALKKHYRVRAFRTSSDQFATIFEDITDKRTADVEIKKLSQAMEQNPAGVVITDPDGNIQYINKSFTLHTQYTLDDVKDVKPRIFREGHIDPQQYCEMWKTLNNRETWSAENRNRKKDHTPFWEQVSISPMVDEQNNITNYILVTEEITDKKRAEQELIIAKEKAEESNKLKTAFLQNISHEIRTPLNAIIGFSELLSDTGIEPNKLKEFTDIIIERGYQLSSIIDNIITVSTLETQQEIVNYDTINIDKLINDHLEAFRPEADKKGIHLLSNNQISNKSFIIRSDKLKIGQILNNLFTNALKFTPSGEIELGAKQIEGQIQFWVRDTGIGIESSKTNIIFERFAQADDTVRSQYGGTGLGLAICKGFANLLGGTIRVESKPGEGSTFFLTIPI